MVLHQESSKALIHAPLLDYRTDTSIFMDSHFVLEILHVSYSNIRHLRNADYWLCPGFSGSSGNLQKWPSGQHGSVRNLFFFFFFQWDINKSILLLFILFPNFRAVIKRRGLGISPGYYERLPQLLSKENKRKIELKEIPNCLIPRLFVVFTGQLEILVTTLQFICSIKTNIFMILSTYIWQRLVLIGATLFDNFFSLVTQSACTEMHFQAPKNSDTVLQDFQSSLVKV